MPQYWQAGERISLQGCHLFFQTTLITRGLQWYGIINGRDIQGGWFGISFGLDPFSISFFFFQEKIPAALDGTTELIPMLVLKGKHFEEKFAVENQQAFWYQDEKEIVSNPCVVL